MITDFFNSTGLVEQLTTTTAPTGGTTKKYSARIASLACRLSSKRVQETDEFGKVTVLEQPRLYCAATTANKLIVETDRITVGSKRFEIVGIVNPGELDRHLQIDLRILR